MKPDQPGRRIGETWIEGWDSLITFGLVLAVVLFTSFVTDPVGDFITEYITTSNIWSWVLSLAIYWLVIDVLLYLIKKVYEGHRQSRESKKEK